VREQSFYARYARIICGVALLIFPVLCYGALGAFKSNTNNVLDWLPSDFEETQLLYEFVERFGSDEIMLISWEGCTLDDPRLERVAEELVKPIIDPATGTEFQWFRKVFTGSGTLDELTSEPLDLSRAEAVQRMQGWLVGADGETTCAMAQVSEVGSMYRADALRHVRQVLEVVGVEWQDSRLGGPTANAVAIDEASNTWIAQMALASAFVGVLVAWKCLKSIRLVTSVLLSALLAWSASLSMVYFSGTNMDAVLLMMPALVFVLTVSGAVHLTNYYNDAVEEFGQGDPSVVQAIRRGWFPCVMASLTTALGLGSLLASELVPVRKFGFFSSLAMLMIVGSLMLFWPAIVSWWPVRNSTSSDTSKLPVHVRWWKPLYHASSRFAHGWLLLFLLILPLFGYGITQLKTSVQLQDLFAPGSPPIQDFDWLQEHIGALTPVEVVLNFPPSPNDDPREFLRRAELVEQLRIRIAASPEVDGTIAATTFAPTLPSSHSARDIMLRRVIAARLSKHRDRLEELQFLHTDETHEGWRISTRVNSLNLEYEHFLEGLNNLIEEFLKEQSDAQTQVSAYVSGGVPLISLAQEQLLEDLVNSFLLAFVLIAVTMIALTRSFQSGLLSMIPNVFPALVTFGTMGLLAFPLDIGTMMTASAAMGIAVDDTLHFLVWFRRGMARGWSRHKAVRYAYSHCASAMLQTSLICGLGLLIFLASPFAPIARFGLMMALMMALAIVGDLILLPAALCSRLGRTRGRNGASQIVPGSRKPV